MDEADRRRLVRLCARISGDAGAAEDLAQETLLEAWRNRHKLHDPEGTDRWLAAIARNVCRRRKVRLERPLDDELAAAEVGKEPGLLAELRPEAATLLVERYVEGLQPRELARRYGISPDAVSMRLARAKEELRETLDGWRTTRIWCSQCGTTRLEIRRDETVTTFRCPSCAPSSATHVLKHDLFGGLERPAALLERVARWSRAFFAEGIGSMRPCTRCGEPVRVRRYDLGAYAACGACGEAVSSSVDGIATSQPQVRTLERPRALPRYDVEHEGIAATVVRYRSVRDSSGADVILERDTLRVLAVA